ncbi:hypothetical protein MTO96_027256 [Rhipicephalus appendiculatus]
MSRSVSCRRAVAAVIDTVPPINPIANHIPAGRCRATDLAAAAGDRNEPSLSSAAHSIAFFLSSARDEEKDVPNTREKARRTLPVESGVRQSGVTNEVKQRLCTLSLDRRTEKGGQREVLGCRPRQGRVVGRRHARRRENRGTAS